MAWIAKLIGICPHSNYKCADDQGWPDNVSCLNCEAEHNYDWQRMELSK
jgi:hypothetical protein